MKKPGRAASTAPCLSRPAGLFFFAVATAFASSPVNAGEADVVAVDIIADGDGAHRFDVTVEHGDEGWDHYADRWDVLDDAGRVIASRTLLHSHVNEQPFTRSLSGVALPRGLGHVTVRAHDTVHGLGGRIMRVAIPGREGDGG